MDKRHWSGLSYLDAIRPEPGWLVEHAILATYSADLVAVVATMLALAGLDDDRGSGSKVDFANAYEQLRDRVKILVQAGRLGWPSKKTPILSILDRFIVEVNTDERQSSWHPKAALIKMINEDSREPAWRLWISSRNLTRSLDWDAGLILTGAVDGSGQQIPGIARLAAEFAQLAQLADFEPEAIRQEIEQVRWQSPAGTQVHEVQLLTPTNRSGLPARPDNLRKLFVISPFIDGTIIKELGRWTNKNTESYLLSTQLELARLRDQSGRPLQSFKHLLSLDAPGFGEEAIPDSAKAEPDPATGEDEEIEARGLHAKLLYAETETNERLLWLGSANATRRGWQGPNTEIIARLTITDEAIAAGLAVFLNELAYPVDLPNLARVEQEDTLEHQLAEARKVVAAQWQVTQRRDERGPWLVADLLPHPEQAEIKLEVGLLACDLVEWPRRQKEVQLPPITKAQETELVQIRLTLADYQLMWLQRAPLDPPPDEERDRRALARHLDPRTFLLWIRALLNVSEGGDGGGDWDVAPPTTRSQSRPGQSEWWAPTLEEVLKAWTRNPDHLRLIDHKVNHYLTLMKEKDGVEQDSPEQKLLVEFENTWMLLRQVLVEGNV